MEVNKEAFIGNYLDKKMKNHNLPMSLEYYNLLNKHTEAAEKAFKKLTKNINGSVNQKNETKTINN